MSKNLNAKMFYAKGHEGDWETVCGVICLYAISWTQCAITAFLACLQMIQETALCSETHFSKFCTHFVKLYTVSKLKC